MWRVRERGLSENRDLWCSVGFFALLYAVSERLGLKRTLSGTLRLEHVCENKVLGPWDEQLQE